MRRTIALCLLYAQTGFAADVDNGAQLHEENCLRCHTPALYTGDERKISDRDALHQRVGFCERMLELLWLEEEVDDVTAYLNEKYYQFEPLK